MKRRDLLRAIPLVGVLPFVGGRDETPEPLTVEDGTGSPDVYAMGSVSAFPRLSGGTAMFMGTGVHWLPDPDQERDMWSLGQSQLYNGRDVAPVFGGFEDGDA